MLSPRSVIVEEAAVTGEALTFGLHPLVARSIVSVCRSVFWAQRGLRSRACQKILDKADFKESAVNRVAKSGAPGSSSIGSSP